VKFDCSKNGTSAKNGSCEIVNCTKDRCTTTGGSCFALAAIVAGLATGILAAIIVAAIIGSATLGGGVYAATQATAFESEDAVQTNPLYTPSEIQSDNPLFSSP